MPTEFLRAFFDYYRREILLASALLIGFVLLFGVGIVAHGQVQRAEAREAERMSISETFALCVRNSTPATIDQCTLQARQARAKMFQRLVA